MLTITQMVCRKCQQVYPLTVGAICPQCHSNLNMVKFVEESAEQSAQRTGLNAYTYEELAKEIVRRGYEVTLTPRR